MNPFSLGRPDHMELSIVIIARNEESTLGRNLEVLTKEIRELDAEIILVDSASTDRTIPIAKTYPVRIVHLEPSRLLSPSAGRYIGTLLSKGEYIYYIDGDMILIEGWLKSGLDRMRNRNLAGVAGRIYFVLPGEEFSLDHPDDFPLGDVKKLDTSAMYRRAALDLCGTFNPYLRGEEEIELGYRLLRAGFTLQRVAVPMAYHVDKAKGVREVDQKAKYFAGTGQLLRRYPGSELARRLLRSTAPVLAQQVAALGTVLALLILLIGGWTTAAAWLAAGAVLFVAALIAVKGFTKVRLRFRSLGLIGYHIAEGFLSGLPDGKDFETRIRYAITESSGGDASREQKSR